MEMESIAKILSLAKSNMAQSYEEYLQSKADRYNSLQGDLTGYDCPICKNKGMVEHIRNGVEVMCECKCMSIRRSLNRIENSGLKDIMKNYTFDKYIATEEWQKRAKTLAKEYLKDYEGNWFFMGGQVGCGKTHLCTAIVSTFLKRGMAAKYMLWRDEVVPLKANVNNDEEYEKVMNELKRVQVLYIDDFFKTERGKVPTSGDINVAFELLNYRYNNHDLITVISSEKSIDDLLEIDEAIGSRIFQRAGKYNVIVPEKIDRNYRLKEGAY